MRHHVAQASQPDVQTASLCQARVPCRLAAAALATAIALLPWVVAVAGEPPRPAFISKPSAARAGDKVKIEFAVTRDTDVEVAILGPDGKLVRHLAAGALGGQKPLHAKNGVAPPPLQAGLSQALEWDGKDDLGKAAAGPFKVRVRAGMSVKFGRTIGGSPYTGNVTDMPYRAPVNGLVVDKDGNLFVKMMSDIHSHGNSGLWPWHVRKFGRTGEYLKTILPYPPSTDPAKASGFALLNTADGAFAPANRSSLYPVFYVFGDELCNRMVDGQLVFVNSRSRQLNFFKPDGSNALKTVPLWPEKAKVGCANWLSIQVAFSPDGRYAYYSNLAATPYDGKRPSDIDPAWPQGRLYRQDLTRTGADPERFFDLELPDWEKTKYWMPSAWDKKTAAAGLDVDAAGNVLLCDLVNQEVVEISPEGRKLSATKVPWPDKVLVSPKAGTLYIVSRAVSRGALPPARLLKVSGRGENAKIASELRLSGAVGGACTLDESGEVPALWLAGEGKLIRVEDRANGFAIAGEDFLNRDRNAITFVGYMDVDRDAESVYVTESRSTVWRFDGETGAGGPVGIKAVDLAVGPGGMLYTWGDQGGYHGPVARYTRDLKPAPLPATGKHTYGKLEGRAGRGCSVCGMDVDSRGWVYAVNGSNSCQMLVFDAEGAPVPAPLDSVSGYGGSLRVDLAGNIYLLQSGLPKDFKTPAGYEKDEAYRATAGTIIRFGPNGGQRVVPVDSGGRGGDPLGFKGVLSLYPGCGPISGWNCDGSCACTKPRFDVDEYGRLYIPNAITFSVAVRDNAGNEIVSFGAYGNYDCAGPQSVEAKPEIPLGWPITAGASDRHIYVGDCLNHRVVRVDKTWAAEETCEVK